MSSDEDNLEVITSLFEIIFIRNKKEEVISVNHTNAHFGILNRYLC